MPLETMTPRRQGSSLARSRPLSATASLAAAMASWVYRAIRLAAFLSRTDSGSQSLTSAASLTFWFSVL